MSPILGSDSLQEGPGVKAGAWEETQDGNHPIVVSPFAKAILSRLLSTVKYGTGL